MKAMNRSYASTSPPGSKRPFLSTFDRLTSSVSSDLLQRPGWERKLSAGTVLNLHLVITQALSQAVRWQLLAANPANGAQPPRPRSTEPYSVDQQMLARLLHATTGTPLELPASLAAATGMLGRTMTPSDLIGAHTDGTPINPDTLSSTWRRLIRKHGFPPIRFHDLRHAHATLMLLQGVHPKIVSERLGHASIGVTLDTYSHVLPSMQAQAVEAFDLAFPHT